MRQHRLSLIGSLIVRKLFAFSLLVLAAVPLTGCAPVVIGGVGAGAMIVDDRRTASTVLMDKEISLTAEARINDAKLRDAHVNVTSFNRRVLLTGEAESDSQRGKIADIVKDVANVREVIDELAVVPPSTFGSRSSDAFLTTKAIARMIDDKRFNANHIKVVSERGNIYLMGLVKRAEADAAAEVAASTAGARGVIKAFEYLD